MYDLVVDGAPVGAPTMIIIPQNVGFVKRKMLISPGLSRSSGDDKMSGSGDV